jgi:hypothetical protein
VVATELEIVVRNTRRIPAPGPDALNLERTTIVEARQQCAFALDQTIQQYRCRNRHFQLQA